MPYLNAGAFGEPRTPRAPTSPPSASLVGSDEKIYLMMNAMQLQVANLTNLMENITSGTPPRAESERSAI